ncbi:MAG: hypothetical protein P4L99_22060 [Chthoniobacter sp.]|nr:hypothetical protein [Chthoniobacter sp.]
MSDPYPTNLTIEIDRPRLRRYLRTKWLLTWLMLFFFIGGFLSFDMTGIAVQRQHLEPGVETFLIIKGGSIGTGACLGVAVLLYFLFSHWLAARVAANLEVAVEGPFLRIRQGAIIRIDRKLHFRSVVEYATVQTFLLRKFEMHALLFTTTAYARAANGLAAGNTIFGIKDCEKVRDTLAEIDALRENG